MTGSFKHFCEHREMDPEIEIVTAQLQYMKLDKEREEQAEEHEFEQKLIAEYGQLWNTEQVTKDFEIRSFMAPYVSVRRRSDNVKGTMQFTHMPRWYFNFKF